MVFNLCAVCDHDWMICTMMTHLWSGETIVSSWHKFPFNCCIKGQHHVLQWNQGSDRFRLAAITLSRAPKNRFGFCPLWHKQNETAISNTFAVSSQLHILFLTSSQNVHPRSCSCNVISSSKILFLLVVASHLVKRRELFVYSTGGKPEEKVFVGTRTRNCSETCEMTVILYSR